MAVQTTTTVGNTLGAAFLSVVGASMYVQLFLHKDATEPFMPLGCLVPHLLRRTCTTTATHKIQFSTSVPLVFSGILLDL
jgi:hypothetical protein